MPAELIATNPWYYAAAAAANGALPFAAYCGIDPTRRKNATREVTQPLKYWLK